MNNNQVTLEIFLPGILSAELVTEFIRQAHILHPKALTGNYNIQAFGEKLASHAHAVILRHQSDGQWIGGCFGYCNNTETQVAYISFIAKTVQTKGIGKKLMNTFCELAKREGMKRLRLEVNSQNTNAQAFYRHYGLEQRGPGTQSFYMEMELK